VGREGRGREVEGLVGVLWALVADRGCCVYGWKRGTENTE